MAELKEQVGRLLASFSASQRIGLAVVIALTLGAMAFLQLSSTGSFTPLYTALSLEDGAAVIQKLKESGVEYRLVDNGSTILVPSDAAAEARLEMASAGLPKTGRIGFELFDQTNLGITEFAEHINYQRALEGELERSILSLTEVEQSRIHITFAKQSVFTESREPAKASVLVRLRPGSTLRARSLTGIRHLVAAAVEGLHADAVSILDTDGNLLSKPRLDAGVDGGQASSALIEYKEAIEKNLVAKVNGALVALLGERHFHAGISVECDFSSGELSEETYDPELSVVLSTQRTEETTGGAEGAYLEAGVPGTASTLPRPREDVVAGSTSNSRISENTAYQTSRMVRHTTIPQGTIKRISAALLIDEVVRWEGEGNERKRVLEPRSAEELEAIREIVAAAIGLDVERGDQLTLQSLPFESTRNPGNTDLPPLDLQSTNAPPEDILQRLRSDPVLMGAVGLAAVLLLAVVGWAVRRLRKGGKSATAKGRRALPGGEEVDQPTPQGTSVAASGQGSAGLLPGAGSQNLVLQAQEVIDKDTELSTGVVQEWLVQGKQR